MNATSTILEAQGLSFKYSKCDVFSPLFIQLPAGVALVRGGEDRGKTTLLRLLAGDLAPDAGELRINGISLQETPAFYKQQVCWMDPRSTSFDQVTPHAYFASVQRRYPTFDALLLVELIEGFSLTEHLNKSIFMLSAGSKRKVWLTAAFASGAAVTLLDEPFAALDKASIGFVMALLQEAAEHPSRAWVMADYEAPGGLPLAAVIDLGG